MEGIRPVCHVIERSSALVTIQQHAYALWIGIEQHGLIAVVPSGQLDVEPLDTPGLVVAAQSTGGTFAVNASVSQAYANEVVAAQSHFPVVAALRETLTSEHLGADREAFREVGIVCVFI